VGKGRIRFGIIAALAVAATAGAVHFAGRPGDESRSADRASPAAPEAVRPGSRPKNASLAELIAESRPGLSREARADLFAAPPPPAPRKKETAPSITPKPATPPFPYKYGGWVAVGATRVHYLQRGNDVIAISKGDVLDGVWRIDAVSEDRFEVSFVPDGERLSMLFASLTREPAAQGGVSASAGGAPEDAPPQRTLAASRSAPSTVPLAVGRADASLAAAPAQSGPRMGVAGAARSAATPLPNASAGPASQSVVPTGKLGVEAPRSGSMPTGPTQPGTSTQLGPGSMPTSPAPTGKLGN